jgi:hypothetical protein
VSKVTAVIDGWVNATGVPVLLEVGDEYEDSHPLVQSRPELFTEPRRGPGRPPGSKSTKDA